MAIDWTYYNTITKTTPLQNKQEIIAEMKDNMSVMLEENHISSFEVKIGMDYYKQKAIVNFSREIDCYFELERMKEKVYNSNSKGIKTHPYELNTGDYITMHEGWDDENGHIQTYIVRSKVDRMRGYDKTFLLSCQYECKLLDSQGNVHTFPLSYSDSRDRVKVTESANIITDLTSYECYVQNNQITSEKLAIGNRVLIWDDLAQKYHPLEIKGTAPFSMKGLITINFNNSQIISDDDNLDLGIANYRTQMEKIGNVEPPLYDIILGEDEVYIDSPFEENPYNLTSVIEPYSNSWSIETLIDGVTLVVDSKNKCYLGIANKPVLVNKIIVLRANLNGMVYTKEIKIRGY